MSLDFYLEYEIDENVFEVFKNNITHNLTKMAKEVGLYEALWHPDKIGATYAVEIIPNLITGYNELIKYPDKYKAFDSPSGWGTYEHFVPFVKTVLDACVKYPSAKIKADV